MDKQEIGSKELQRFIEQVAKLDGKEFVGLAYLLKIKLVEDDGERTPRPLDKMLEDIIDAFTALNRKQRRKLAKFISVASKRGGK